MSTASAAPTAGAGVSAVPAVRIHDTVVLQRGHADSWTERLRREYAPGAARRGLALESVAREHVGTDTVAVHILWTLPGIRAFFGMRAAAGTDPSVAAFWSATDEIAVRRERRVTAPEPAVDPALDPAVDSPVDGEVPA
ncbi:hypothetical protein [Streptodolium elevatio]